MSRKFDPTDNNKGGGLDIPGWVIVLSLIFATPLGVILIILNAVSKTASKTEFKRHDTINGEMLEREIRHGVEKGLRGLEKGFERLEREFGNTQWHSPSNGSDKDAKYGNDQKPENNAASEDKMPKGSSSFAESHNSEKSKKAKKSPVVKREAPEVISLIAVIVFLLAGISRLDNIIAAPFGLAGLFDVISGVIPFIGAGVSYIAHKFFKNSRERCAVYAVLIGEAEYCKLDTLVSATGVSKAKVRRELQNMISKGIFGSGAYIDFGRDMFFRSTEAAGRFDMQDTADTSRSAIHDEEQVKDRVEQDEYRRIILEIRRLNDEIADIAVSERIYRIEEHTQHIFDFIKEHPERRGNIRTFMNYYLPTTLKLLTSYAKIERVGVAGENMKKSKQSIEETLDMLVYAFEREVDMLFESESIDISTDIDVLEAMLRKDGFSGGIDAGQAAQSASSPDSVSDTDDQK